MNDNEWKQLRRLCGYLQDGSHTVVTLFQDDATGAYHIKLGKHDYYGSSFEEALKKAMVVHDHG